MSELEDAYAQVKRAMVLLAEADMTLQRELGAVVRSVADARAAAVRASREVRKIVNGQPVA